MRLRLELPLPTNIVSPISQHHRLRPPARHITIPHAHKCAVSDQLPRNSPEGWTLGGLCTSG